MSDLLAACLLYGGFMGTNLDCDFSVLALSKYAYSFKLTSLNLLVFLRLYYSIVILNRE